MAAAALAGIQVGAAIVASRLVINDIGPAALALARYTIALLCLLPMVLAGNRVTFSRRDFMFVMGLGVVQFGLLIALLNIGLQFIHATWVAMLFATFPLMTIIIAALLGRERLCAPKVMGVVLTIAGVGAALGGKLLDGVARDEWIGVLAVLAAALCGALCSVFYRPYLERYPTLPIGALAMAAAVAFLFVLAAMETASIGFPVLDVVGWTVVIFIGLSSGIGYLLWLWALKNTTPTKVTMFLSLSPLTAALLGVGFLDEPLTIGTAVGLTGVMMGLWIAARNLEPNLATRKG
ncbi:MAG: DMT family transporter [Geminicoccaceae bacterium]